LEEYTRVVELQPRHLDARLRVGDALMALGELQRAAVVYTQLARYAAQAAYPLRALVAIKILTALEPQLETLLRAFAELYGSDSARLGRSVRHSLPTGDEALPTPAVAADVEPPADPHARAEHIAASYSQESAVFPEKLIPIPVLSLLPAAELARLVSAVELVRVRPDTTLVEQGGAGDTCFILARGSVRVTRRDGQGQLHDLATLREGAIFGEMALLSSSPRSASVTAIEACDLLALRRDALLAAAEGADGVRQTLTSFASERLLGSLMATSPVFHALDRDQRAARLRRFATLEIDAGTSIIRQGEPGRGLYVVLLGEVAVRREQPEPSIELARLEPGEMFGETSLLHAEPTNASVIATVPSTLLFLERAYFERLVSAVPEVRADLDRLSQERSRNTLERISTLSNPPAEPEIEIEILI
jgi:CRP-like cAMP-binding protein